MFGVAYMYGDGLVFLFVVGKCCLARVRVLFAVIMTSICYLVCFMDGQIFDEYWWCGEQTFTWPGPSVMVLTTSFMMEVLPAC